VAGAKICGLSISMGRPLHITESQPVDSGNRLAAFEPTAGISIRCNSIKISAVCQYLLSANSDKPIAATNYRTSFQRRMLENYQP
jgi:hypothetical protein